MSVLTPTPPWYEILTFGSIHSTSLPVLTYEAIEHSPVTLQSIRTCEGIGHKQRAVWAKQASDTALALIFNVALWPCVTQRSGGWGFK